MRNPFQDWTTRQWATVGGVLVAILVVVGVAIAAGGGDDEPEEAATTTSSSTTEATTTTAAPAPGYPLTGRPIDDPAKATRPVLAVKIDNAEPRSGQGGRPQAGINQADVVYEEVVEGSVTRFLALFHSQDADPVGPVRSARTTDILLMAPLNRPLFAWSGANAGVAGQVRAADLVDVGFDAATSVFYRDRSRPAPYNLFSSTAAIRGAAGDQGERPPPALFTYRAEGEAPAGGREVPGVHINFGGGPGSAPVDFDWDGTGWARSQRGDAHVDAAGQRLAPPNVIVQLTPYVEVQCCDAAGFPIVEAQLVGEGDALVFTAGRVIEARWSRPGLGDVTTYTVDGEPVALTPGQTWVSIAPPGSATVK
jgi:hypothetical protein